MILDQKEAAFKGIQNDLGTYVAFELHSVLWHRIKVTIRYYRGRFATTIF